MDPLAGGEVPGNDVAFVRFDPEKPPHPNQRRGHEKSRGLGSGERNLATRWQTLSKRELVFAKWLLQSPPRVVGHRSLIDVGDWKFCRRYLFRARKPINGARVNSLDLILRERGSARVEVELGEKFARIHRLLSRQGVVELGSDCDLTGGRFN